MTRTNKMLRVAFIVFASITTVLLIADVILGATGVLSTNHVIAVIFMFLLPIFAGITFTLLTLYSTGLANAKSTKLENRYNLGRENNFYNYYHFQRRVNRIDFIHRRSKTKEAYLLAFTGSKQNTMRNLDRNDIVRQFNGHISDFLTEYFVPKLQRNITYCFYHGSFLIYRYGSESEIRSMISVLETKMFEIGKEKDLKIYIQPFFGYVRVDHDEDLIEIVDKAVFARNISENRFETVTVWHDEMLENKNAIDVEELKSGLDNDEFVVYYQPKYNLASKRFISSEALIRWNSKKFGFLPPSRFLDAAMSSGLIHNIDVFVLRKVCQDLADSKKKGRRLIPVSINFSMFEFYSPNFLGLIKSTIEEFDINPSLIEIEITETTSQVNTFLTISIAKKLRSYGLRVLMDDFGVGYANLDNLMRIPFNSVKIDKSFIDRIVIDTKSKELVKFLVNLCKINGLEVIAEGVDNQSQVDILKKAKCDTIQGYFYSQPLSKKDYDKFLLDNPFEDKEGK